MLTNKIFICLTRPNFASESAYRFLVTCKICVLIFLEVVVVIRVSVYSIWKLHRDQLCARICRESRGIGEEKVRLIALYPSGESRTSDGLTIRYNQRENLSLFVTPVAPFSRPQIAFSTGDYPLSPAPSASWRSLSSLDSSIKILGMKRANERLVLSRSPSLASRVLHACDGSGATRKTRHTCAFLSGGAKSAIAFKYS